MAKSAALERLLTKLGEIRANPSAPDASEQLGKALDHSISYVVERAAQLVKELKLTALTPNLARAFDYWMTHDDKGCAAKTIIATALYEFGADTPELFLTGVKHIQREPAWGGSVDVAASLRGVCALGLVRIAHRDAMLYVTDLLSDPEPQARIVAVRALAYSGRDEGALLLRLKIRTGDRATEVTAEALTALMKLAPQKSIPLVTDFLDDPDEMIRESAALALGESRRSEALEVLRDHVESRPDPERRRPLLLAIAVSRQPTAIAFLVSLVESADVATAMHAIEALKIYRHDSAIRASVTEAAGKRSEPSIKRTAGEFLV